MHAIKTNSMRIKINFIGNDKPVTQRLNKEVNGFINRLLGENNEYHGKFSNYSVSPMLGYIIDKEHHCLSYPEGAYIFVSSNDVTFMEKIINGLCFLSGDVFVGPLQLNKEKMFEIDNFSVAKYYDIVRTNGPVIVKDDRKPVTFKDEEFLPILREKSIKKLIHNGIAEKDANSIKIELFHPEHARTEMHEIGRQKNIASRVMFRISGNIHARQTLYELGLGVSTGFGFGSVSLRKSIISNN